MQHYNWIVSVNIPAHYYPGKSREITIKFINTLGALKNDETRGSPWIYLAVRIIKDATSRKKLKIVSFASRMHFNYRCDDLHLDRSVCFLQSTGSIRGFQSYFNDTIHWQVMIVTFDTLHIQYLYGEIYFLKII